MMVNVAEESMDGGATAPFLFEGVGDGDVGVIDKLSETSFSWCSRRRWCEHSVRVFKDVGEVIATSGHVFVEEVEEM